jgi:peptidoglycan hydrolase CwlO-like protein
MKDNITLIAIVIIIGLILWNLFTTNKIKTDVEGYKKNIELIQTKIDSAKTENGKLTKKIDSLNTQIGVVNNEINHIDNNITIIKKQTNDKVNSVDNMSNLELKRFFTNRYNQYDTTK